MRRWLLSSHRLKLHQIELEAWSQLTNHRYRNKFMLFVISLNSVKLSLSARDSPPAPTPTPEWYGVALRLDSFGVCTLIQTQHFLPQVLRCGADMVGVCMMGWHVRKIFPTPNNYAENEKYNSTIKTRHIS